MDADLSGDDDPTFLVTTVQPMLKGAFRGKKVRVKAEALELTCEFLRCLTIEAVQRSAQQASLEGTNNVEPRHVQAILPQLLLDF
mmetsp:Transcript_16756/g.68569  ORF Transcript_16756/g.68569 Transcript_16756/m.68569 type:complete len:85 (+) Transcript_16756:141-395(+)